MQITGSGLKRPEIQEINIESFGENVTILDEHLRDTDIHVNAEKITEIDEPDELTQIDSTDTNSTLWGKIKKSISVLMDHVDKIASETTLGHIKIGTGLHTEKDGTTSVKIANDLETDDSTIALSAAMGVQLGSDLDKTNTKLDQHIGEVASSNTLGHIKIGNGLQTTADGTTSVKIANNLTTDDSTTALSAAMGKSLNETLKGKAQTNHASSGTGYGIGNASQYGHVKLSDNYTSNIGNASAALGASQAALYNAYYDLNNKLAYSNGTATVNTTYSTVITEYAYVKWSKWGRLVIVDIYGIDTKAGYSTDNVAVLASGLPVPQIDATKTSATVYQYSDGATKICRLAVRSDGRIMYWYNGTSIAANLNHSFSYISAN